MVDKLLGSGSFGDVFKCKSRSNGVIYAVKKSRCPFKGRYDRDHKLKEVAKHEIIPKHPNLIQFIEAWEENAHLYIVIELCECSLNEFVDTYRSNIMNGVCINDDIHRKSKSSKSINNQDFDTFGVISIPEDILFNILIDLLMALSHLHGHDLIHLDIKPENVFMSNGVCKLGDFGLMIDLNAPDESSNAIEGDPKYMARELMAGKFSKSADMFSLGVSMLEICFDIDLPSGGDDWHNLRNDLIPFHDFNHKISDDMKCIISSMMASDPKERPSADQVLNRDMKMKKRVKKRSLKVTFLEVSRKLRNLFLILIHYLSLILFVDYISDHMNHKKDPDIDTDASHDSSSFGSMKGTRDANETLASSFQAQTMSPISAGRRNNNHRLQNFFDDNEIDNELLGIKPLLAPTPAPAKDDPFPRYQLRSRDKMKTPPLTAFRKRCVTSPASFSVSQKMKKNVSASIPTPKFVDNNRKNGVCPDSPAILSCVSMAGHGSRSRPKKGPISRLRMMTPVNGTPKDVSKDGQQEVKSSSFYDFSDDDNDRYESFVNNEPNSIVGPKNLMSIFDSLDE